MPFDVLHLAAVLVGAVVGAVVVGGEMGRAVRRADAAARAARAEERRAVADWLRLNAADKLAEMGRTDPGRDWDTLCGAAVALESAADMMADRTARLEGGSADLPAGGVGALQEMIVGMEERRRSQSAEAAQSAVEGERA